MPEGPSLVILKEDLQPFIGQQVLFAKGYAKGFDPDFLINEVITNVRSWGKYLIISFRNFSIKIHLGLFGSYKINERGKNQASLHIGCEHDEVNFYISNVKLLEVPAEQLFDWTADVMSPNFDIKHARSKLLTKPEKLICDALLDQDIFAGSGNIIKNEVLFRTKVHPESKIGLIPLRKQIQIIKEVLNFCRDFYHWRKAGILRQHLQAHEKQMCPRNHMPLIKADLGKTKRHCYFCTICQKKYN